MIEDPIKTSEILSDDEGKPAEIALYLFEMWINGLRYGGEIPAVSWDAAEEMVKSFGAKVIGRSVETTMASMCSVCGGEIKHDTEHPLPLPDVDEWSDFLEP